MPVETVSGPPTAFDAAQEIGEEICELARGRDLPHDNPVEALIALMNQLVVSPNSVFQEPPEYVRDLGPASVPADMSVQSSHGFFDVLKSRASRRDFGSDPLDLPRLTSLLGWTVGCRSETIAYDWRNAPQRYVPSAGGLASIDAYVIANNVAGLECGAYYFDYRAGLVPVSSGYMAQKLADMMPGQDWLARAAAVVVFVGNTKRVVHKYDVMGFKLMMLDAGVAAGHAELVAAGLELRATILGGLPADQLGRLLGLDNRGRVPLATLALGTRTGHA